MIPDGAFPGTQQLLKIEPTAVQPSWLWDGGLSQRPSTKLSSTIAAVGRGRAERSLCVRAGSLREPGSFFQPEGNYLNQGCEGNQTCRRKASKPLHYQEQENETVSVQEGAGLVT